jgi:hypothetical protein
MQANDLIADLRAEVSAWWEGKMADHRSSVIAAAAAALVTNHVSLFVFLFYFSIIRNMYYIVVCCTHTPKYVTIDLQLFCGKYEKVLFIIF